MTILIIANTRYKGGLSGSDAIYESFKKYWPCEVRTVSCGIEYSPFFLCYIQRILMSIVSALFDFRRFDFVYSSSDFLPDAIAGFIYRIKGSKWVAGYYLAAFKSNPLHYYTQKVVRKLIEWFADMVVVTNPTMYHIFPNKKKTWINGGIDLKLAGLSNNEKTYDAVFCGRIHPSKGIDELIHIWGLVREQIPTAKLAVIGDGDLGKDYIKQKLFAKYGLKKYNGVDLLGYMGEERFEVYKKSKTVLYTTPSKYDHFSMAPIEAMACGCPVVHFDIPTNRYFVEECGMPNVGIAITNKHFAELIVKVIQDQNVLTCWGIYSYQWAQQFDYSKQALKVFNDIKRELFQCQQ